jgi:glycosyltransferase involved in cell wall biosynthesis
MIYLDVTSAASSPVNMGVHRTVRGVFRHLADSAPQGAGVTPLRWDFQRRGYARLSARERGFLEHPFAAYESPQAVPGSFSLATWREVWRDQRTRAERRVDLAGVMGAGDVLLIPDLCWDRRIDGWKDFGEWPGKKIAIFHDAMPLNIPGQSGSNDALFREYVVALGRMDAVICISQEVRADLLRYWGKYGVSVKPTPVLTWPVPFSGPRPGNPPNRESRRLIYVARLKLRKNHLVLLKAAEVLWERGVEFSLDLIGVEDAFLDTRRILKEVRRLARAGRPVRWRKHISDAELNAAYRDCAFTVFPSKMEGFGLPVIESLWHRRPVICGSNGAIGEVAAEGGGCLQIDQNDPGALTEAMREVLENEGLYARLYEGADGRKFRSWEDYGRELAEVLAGAGCPS